MSDPHNFGRRVLRSDEWFLKPRSVYWEEFFMGSSGFLSEFLTAKIPREFLPPWYRLKEKISVISDSSNSGKSLALQSVDPIVTEKLLVEVGSAIAYFTYFGITDLHSENVVFVKNSLNETILTPIDIEMVFQKVTLPSETIIVKPEAPELKRFVTKEGLITLKDKLTARDVALLVKAYLITLNNINSCSEELAREHVELIKRDNPPIRILIDSTENYHTALIKNDFSCFEDEEIEQLRRGDIPYFYRYFNDECIYFYKDATLGISDSLKISSAKRNNAMNFVRTYENIFPSLIEFQTCYKAGALQLASHFLRGFGVASATVEEFKLEKTDQLLTIVSEELSINIGLNL